MGVSTFNLSIPAGANVWFWVGAILLLVACVALIVAVLRWIRNRDK